MFTSFLSAAFHQTSDAVATAFIKPGFFSVCLMQLFEKLNFFCLIIDVRKKEDVFWMSFDTFEDNAYKLFIAP